MSYLCVVAGQMQSLWRGQKANLLRGHVQIVVWSFCIEVESSDNWFSYMNVLVIFCSRFILHDCGLIGLQLEKCKNVDFGRCPRTYCSGQPCLPMGQSDVSRTSTVKIYCPKCEDIYYPRSKYQGSILFHMDCLLLCHVMWQSIGVHCRNNQFPHFLEHLLIMLWHHVCNCHCSSLAFLELWHFNHSKRNPDLSWISFRVWDSTLLSFAPVS